MANRAKAVWTPLAYNDLFCPGPNPSLNACVGENGGPYDYYAYSRGYFRAGDVLWKHLMADGHTPRGLDLLVYPLIYVYRHAVELGLKDLCRVVPRIFGEPARAQFDHTLSSWKFLRPYLTRDDEVFDSNDPDLDVVDRIIRDLESVDPNAVAFRFPESTEFVPSVRGAVRLINAEVFCEQMKILANAFDYWSWHANDIMDRREP